MEKNDLESRWYGLQFDVRRSIRYHQCRRAFFDRLDQWGNALSVIFGSATIYGVLESSHHTLALLCAAGVTILSTVNLVFGTAQKARLHHDLARRFIALECELLDEETEAEYKRLYAQRLDIEAEEPPTLRVLDALCYNATVQAEGLPKEYQTGIISGVQRFWAPLLDWQFDKIASPPEQPASEQEPLT